MREVYCVRDCVRDCVPDCVCVNTLGTKVEAAPLWWWCM